MVRIVTGLGRSGLHDWVIQRLSAVVMAVYLFYLLYWIAISPNLAQITWQTLFGDSFFRVFSILALLSLISHAWIGLWTVSTDYFKPPRLRLLFQSLVILFCLGNLVWGVQILWGL